MTETDIKTEAVKHKLRLLSQAEVMEIWPIKRSYLSRLTNHPNESKRLPSYQIGRRKVYDPDELMWFREKHRFTPRKRREPCPT